MFFYQQVFKAKAHRELLLAIVVMSTITFSKVYFISNAAAQSFNLTTPRVAAMAGAGIGGSKANSALILNPAGMSAGAFYAVDANYFRTSDKANLFGINIVDSQTRYTRDRFALGIGYQTRLVDGEASAHDAQLGFSRPISKIGNMLLLLGGSARYIYDEQSQRDNFDINAGVMLQLSSLISLGFVGSELLEEDHRLIGGGLSLTTKQIAVNLDYLRQLANQQNQYRAGAEFMISDSLVLRGGYSFQPATSANPSENQGNLLDQTSLSSTTTEDFKQWSMGLAFVGLGGGDGQLSLSYSEEVETEHSFFGISLSTYLRMNEN